jgi:hypothetical protein
MNVKLQTIYSCSPFQSIFETTTKPKMMLCKSYYTAAETSDLIEPLNKRIKGNFSGRNEKRHTKIHSFILNEDVIAFNQSG